MKILLVEDNEDSRNLLVKVIRAYGHEAMAAANGAEALEQALVQPPDIIVSDILMPKMDGYQLCQECKQNEQLQNIPFVFYSATYTLDEDKKFALSLGADAFILKPSEPDILVQTLSEVFEKAKAGALAPPEVAPLEPSLFLTEHDKRIFAKLEDKVAQLEVEITERKRAEEALRESERRYRLLAENAKDVIWTVDMNMRPTYMSPSVTYLLGYSVEEAIAKPMEAVFTPASFEISMKTFSEELAVENMEQKDLFRSRTLELELNRKDGSIVPVEIKYTFIREPDGRPIAILAIARDITERKRAEDRIKRAAEEWRRTFDSITDLVSIHDKDFRLVRVNKAFADAFKMKPVELIGKPCYEIVHGTNEPLPNCPHKKTIKTKKPATAEFFEPHLGMHLEISTSPIFDEKGEVVASVHVTRDITERKRMEEQLIVSDRLASIGELSSGIAHELNNPLTGVIGFSQLLMDKDVSDEVKDDLKIISSEALRAAEVVKNLLIFARKHAPLKQLVNIDSIIEKVLELRAYEQKVNNVQVNTRFAPDLPAIMADYFQLQQVFLNIVINAEYFMIEAHRRGTLAITTERTGDIIKASFADDGPGIAKENLGHLFDPFFTTKEAGKGTGLGLSICHGIITEHGGRIYAESELGKGATFIVELPISK